MTWHLTVPGETYATAREQFTWDIPDDYNAARDCLGKHDETDQPALYQAYPDGRRETYTFDDLDRLSTSCCSTSPPRGSRRSSSTTSERCSTKSSRRT